jgi:spore maturation protein CgeB
MLTVATILDPFSSLCFSSEWNEIPLRSDNYISKISKANKIDFLFVESVWRGPGNTWKHYFVTKKKDRFPRGMAQLTRLIKECKKRNIPTIFWSKEDPVHFNHFVTAASLFDYVATTDVNCVSKYKKRLNHSRIFVLSFAAQSTLHNPVGLENRQFNVCFAGTCRNKQYPNRAKAMDIILRPALKFGLHIYDRKQTGSSGEPFPEIYKNNIKGGVSYEKIINKYKCYKVFLNINSIDNSPTMFSRRVFELLACGTPVVSSHSVGIEKLLPEVLISRTASETARHIKMLLKNTEYWKRLSKKGIERVFSYHTYSHRVQKICKKLNIEIPIETKNKISALQDFIS